MTDLSMAKKAGTAAFDVEATRTYDSLERPHFLLPHGNVVPEMLA